MLTPHNYHGKPSLPSSKSIFTPTQFPNPLPLLRELDSPIKTHKNQPSFNNPIDDKRNQLSLSPLKSPKGRPTLEIKTKAASEMHSPSPVKEDFKQSRRLNSGTRNSGLDSSLDFIETGSRKTNILQKSGIRTMQKKAKTGPPIDVKRAKKVNLSQVKDFIEKYKLKFSSGHGSKAIEKCTNLLATENDPFILENLFPGQYTMYMNVNVNTGLNSDYMKSSSKFSFGNLSNDKMNANDATPTSYGDNITILPHIRGIRHGTEIDSQNSRAYTDGQMPDSRASICDARLSAVSSIFGVKKWKALPQMEAESFRESLCLYQDFIHRSALLVIEAGYRDSSMDLGFCELLWDDSKVGTLHLSKLFVQKVYSKMGFLVPILIGVIDHLFKSYNIDKLTIDLMPGNGTMCDAVAMAGMKFGKVFKKNNQKWQTFTLRKKDFYNGFQEIFGITVNNSPTGSPVKGLNKQI